MTDVEYNVDALTARENLEIDDALGNVYRAINNFKANVDAESALAVRKTTLNLLYGVVTPIAAGHTDFHVGDVVNIVGSAAHKEYIIKKIDKPNGYARIARNIKTDRIDMTNAVFSIGLADLVDKEEDGDEQE